MLQAPYNSASICAFIADRPAFTFAQSRKPFLNMSPSQPDEVTQDIFELIGRGEQIEQAARAMKAISHPLRLKILCVLGDQEVNVQEIVEAVGTTQSNISQHLGILRDKSILRARKEANKVFYSVSDPRTLALIAGMREVFCGAKSPASLVVDENSPFGSRTA